MTRIRLAGLTLAFSIVLAGAPSSAQNDVPPSVVQAEQQRIAAMDMAAKTAVSVFAPNGKGGGSGVVISPDGFALSNFHVTSPVGDYMKCGMADGRVYDAVIVSIDPTGDVALIKLFGRDDFPCAEMGDSDDVRVGDWCFAVGNPFLLATNLQPTVSYGIISGIHRYQYPSRSILEYADCLQTDAAINPGNSGGPLFNAQGQLIGINGRCSFEKRGRVNVGVGYSISINQIKNFMGHLHSGRVVDHATLGATVDTDSEGRVVVSNILNSSDAYRRGLRYGDEIESFAGRTISTANEFKNVLGIFPKGWRVPLSYWRDDQRREIHVRLAGVHSREELLVRAQLTPPEPDKPPGKPNGRKKPEKPEGEKPERPHGPGQPPAAEVAVPEHLVKYIVSRTGYANYYFNQQNQQRVWSAFTKGRDCQGRTGDWTIRGALANGAPVRLVLGDEQSTARIGEDTYTVDADQGLGEQLHPEGSGGMLAALHLWRRLLVVGPDRYGEVFYLGTVPQDGRNELCDALVGIYDVAESQFVFDTETGQLLKLEMAPDAEVDPCEIEFDDYRDVEGRALPFRWTVRHGDGEFAVLQVEQIRFPSAVTPEA